MKRIIILLLIFILLLASCSKVEKNSKSLTEGINSKPVRLKEIDLTENILDFNLKIFKNLLDDRNTLISPLSIMTALAMTTNGADNNTLKEFEKAYNSSIDQINSYLYQYNKLLKSSNDLKVKDANSIWIRDIKEMKVEKDFLQKNKDYYDAQIFKVPFNNQTVKDINAWVDKKTEGKIKKVIDERNIDAYMILINTLNFDAKWDILYKKHQVRDAEFTNYDKKVKVTKFLNSNESSFIKLENAKGFKKDYKGNNFSFVALLPDEGVSIDDFIKSLDAKDIIEGIKNSKNQNIIVRMPKFETTGSYKLVKALKEIGIKEAFTEQADFTSITKMKGGEKLYITDVIHKTMINVSEKGTEAGAVTAVAMEKSEAPQVKEEIIFNRPFVYMIVDNKYSLPLFIGTLKNVK